MRAWLWTLPAILVAALDLALRWEHVRRWGWPELAFYAASIVYVLAWAWLVGRALRPRPGLRPWLFWTGLAALASLSAFMLVVHFSHYFYFGIQPTVVAFGYLFQETLETLTIVADQLTPGTQLILLGVAVAMFGLWRVAVSRAVDGRRRLGGAWLALGLLVLLTPALHNNVAMSQGNFMPSVNFIFSASKAAEFRLRGEGAFRRLQVGNRIALPAQPAPMPYNLLVIVAESLRATNLGYMGYGRDTSPREDAFFAGRPEQVFIFRQCYSNSTTTSESVPSLTTGVHPIEDYRRLHRMPLLFEYPAAFPETVTFLLAAHAYDVANYRLFFQSRHLDRLYFQEMSGHPMFNSIGMDDALLLPELRDVLGRMTPTQRFAGILHLNGTHHPYRVPPAFERWRGEPLLNAYDNAIAYEDHLLGQVLDLLRAAGRLDNTIVFFTSDHGEGFGEHGINGHRRTFYEEIIHVPCWLHLPRELVAAHGEGLRVNTERNVSNLDLVPTLVDLLGLNAEPAVRALTEGMWGQSLLRPVDAQRLILGQNGDVTSHLFEGFVLLRGPQRFLYHSEGGHDRFGLYDLRDDPQQRRDLWPDNPTGHARELARLLESFPALARLAARNGTQPAAGN
ncbi:MAG: sulfatase-like hydrolase/transferase [Candidatus Lambdaproteobacteria bacterium]|nr:sulfatase-like hydrolase/transferase [Candidatus Lambdaproteobacteria bacterium]